MTIVNFSSGSLSMCQRHFGCFICTKRIFSPKLYEPGTIIIRVISLEHNSLVFHHCSLYFTATCSIVTLCTLAPLQSNLEMSSHIFFFFFFKDNVITSLHFLTLLIFSLMLLQIFQTPYNSLFPQTSRVSSASFLSFLLLRLNLHVLRTVITTLPAFLFL